jgi:hypothetical protein
MDTEPETMIRIGGSLCLQSAPKASGTRNRFRDNPIESADESEPTASPVFGGRTDFSNRLLFPQMNADWRRSPILIPCGEPGERFGDANRGIVSSNQCRSVRISG